MKAIAQSEIISLISDINAFADSSEQLISSTQANYEKEKHLLLNGHSSELSSLEKTYRANCAAVRNKSGKTINDAKIILTEVDKLDAQLSKVDKYYVKTKTKKMELLADTTSDEYSDATDYFGTLEKIKADFKVLFKKYSEDILPGLINGLNYLFSSKRKKDYEELIVLRNTVAAFVKEIEEMLPPITEENLSALKEQYITERGKATERQKQELDAFENRHLATLDKVAEKICSDLDNILPDEFVSYLHALVSNYSAGIFKVNASQSIQDETLYMMFVDYPVDALVQSQVVASVIKDKCAGLLAENGIRFPVLTSLTDAPVWMIANDNSNPTAVQELTHSMMFGFLSSCPVAQLSFTVVDPENRGNSIAPFFDAKKKLPELFGEKIVISRDEISSMIREANEKIENILQDKLGNQFENIFEYARSTPGYSVNAEVLVLYDFPKGFDERTLAELRNILRNGSRCGIYSVISFLPDNEGNISKEYQQSLQSIRDLSLALEQSDAFFSYRGLPVSYFAMPDKTEFAKFFSKYMLIFEGIKNRGIAFSPLIRKLVEAKDSIELDEHIAYIGAMMERYEKLYAQVPSMQASFPNLVALGKVLYPADVFSESIGYQHIVESFGKEYNGDTESNQFVELPLTFDLRSSFNLFLNCTESNAPGMLRFTHHVIWSFLSAMPVTKVNVCVFDSEQRGNSIIPFLDFRKKSPDTFDQKIYTSQEAMKERLQKINEQIDEFIQEKLGNKYKDILDYNISTPNRAEPITLLVIFDFPSGMDGQSIDLLTNILRNGNKCGVFTVIGYNPNITYSRYESIDERLEQIGKHCASIDFRDGHYGLMPYNLQINIPEAPNSAVVDAFVADYTKKSETIKKQGLSFRDIISKDLFSMDSSKSLKIPVGVGDGDSIVSIAIGEGSSHHGLIAGATGSGKSTLLHTLIMSAMLHYSPEQLHLYLMDFKSGTEFKIYESVRLPHIQLLALDAMQEFGESILENLVSEMEKRGAMFKEAGQTSLKGYTQATGKPLPRILVIMDEFQILFNDATNRKVAMNCAELTKRIVTEGRAFGIHLLMATQSTKVISDLTISRGTIEQMRIRIGLKCGEDDARYLFSDENDSKALSMMKGPIGTAVMNLDYTEQQNIGFRAAYCDDATQKEYLDLISKTFADRPSTLQTFEGGRTTKLLDHFRDHAIATTSSLPVTIQMGTLIKVAPPFELVVDKKRKHNLLVCGSNEAMATTVANNYIISALMNTNASVCCIDGDKLVGDDGASEFYSAVAEKCSRFKVAEDRADIIRFIRAIYEKYSAWKKQNSDEVIFVVIKNLQFLDIVKSMFKGELIDESEFVEEEIAQEAPDVSADPFAAINTMFANKDSGGNLSVGEKLIKLVDDGSGFGIHFIVTSLEYQTVRESMYYGENLLSKFPERVIFSLGENDADNLIESVSVTGLRENTVYFTDGVKNTFQMKPYVTPSIEETSDILGSVPFEKGENNGEHGQHFGK